MGLRLAVSMGLTNVILESNSLTIVNLLKNPDNTPREHLLFNLIMCISQLMRKLTCVQLDHCFREANSRLTFWQRKLVTFNWVLKCWMNLQLVCCSVWIWMLEVVWLPVAYLGFPPTSFTFIFFVVLLFVFPYFSAVIFLYYQKIYILNCKFILNPN